VWVGDHIAFAVPILDPLQPLAQAAVVSRRLTLATGVYLLPLHRPTPVAKQVATLDHLTEGRLIFGVGVGGEFPKEYEAAVCRSMSGSLASRKASRYCASCGAARQPPTTAAFSRSRTCACCRRRARWMDHQSGAAAAPNRSCDALANERTDGSLMS
jgi:hypothetical protein